MLQGLLIYQQKYHPFPLYFQVTVFWKVFSKALDPHHESLTVAPEKSCICTHALFSRSRWVNSSFPQQRYWKWTFVRYACISYSYFYTFLSYPLKHVSDSLIISFTCHCLSPCAYQVLFTSTLCILKSLLLDTDGKVTPFFKWKML